MILFFNHFKKKIFLSTRHIRIIFNFFVRAFLLSKTCIGASNYDVTKKVYMRHFLNILMHYHYYFIIGS